MYYVYRTMAGFFFVCNSPDLSLPQYGPFTLDEANAETAWRNYKMGGQEVAL